MDSHIILLVLSIVGLGALAANYLLKQLKRRRARKWPTAGGHVESVVLDLRETGEQQSKWVATVKYRYIAQDKSCFGSIQRYFMMKGRAEKWARWYTIDRSLTVRVNPHNPTDSVLFENEQH